PHRRRGAPVSTGAPQDLVTGSAADPADDEAGSVVLVPAEVRQVRVEVVPTGAERVTGVTPAPGAGGGAEVGQRLQLGAAAREPPVRGGVGAEVPRLLDDVARVTEGDDGRDVAEIGRAGRPDDGGGPDLGVAGDDVQHDVGALRVAHQHLLLVRAAAD